MRALITITTLLFCVSLADFTSEAAEKRDPNAVAFERLTKLVGQWQSTDGKASLTYELTAGGTAILEREVAEGHPEMLTLYHRDGNRLMLTHYCMTGNQPRMVAQPFDAENGELTFSFLDATNLSSADAGHMRTVKLRFVDDNHIESEWQFYENRKPTITVRARYARVR